MSATIDPAVETFVPVADGVRLFVRSLGAGPPLLVPMPYRCREYDVLAATHRLVLYDPRGRGRSSEVDPACLSFEDDVADMEALREALGLETVALLGWSYLGAVAARYAMLHPARVSRLVLVAPTGVRCDAQALRAEQTKRLQAAVPRLMKRLREGTVIPPAEGRALAYAMVVTRCAKAPPWPGMAEEHFLGVLSHALDERRRYFNGMQGLLRTMADWDWRADGRKMSCPVLVVCGAADLLPHQLCAEWVDAVPTSRGLVLPAVGHFPSLEDPATFFAVVGAFLSGCWPAGSFARDACAPLVEGEGASLQR